MAASYMIGLDYGSESARGVLVDVATGEQVASRVHPYRHGILTQRLPDGTPLPARWALQVAPDYLEAAQEILAALGRGREIASIGIDFTASSPMPAAADGRPLSDLLPGEPHAYVKLWKHGAAQRQADEINRRGGDFLDNFGGKVSCEWMLAKAGQVAEEAPQVWARTDRFIEAGDWLVWQLTGVETRSLGFAAYKAQYTAEAGYPAGLVPGLAERLAPPQPIGSPGGGLSSGWRERTGVQGPAVVAVVVIDSHAVLPAIGAVSTGSLVGALGTSAVYLYLSESYRPLPAGIEGVARDGSIRGLWCYEAGQACFGDVLAWFARAFPRGADLAESLRSWNQAAEEVDPARHHLVALDWWNGNRVPLADSGLSGLLLGMTTQTTGAGIYRALMESICFGARNIAERFGQAGFAVDRIILTSGLAQHNPLLVRIMAEVLGREVQVSQLDNATAVGAAIHGAVAAGLVSGYPEGAARFGARRFTTVAPDPGRIEAYRRLYQQYQALAGDEAIRRSMHGLEQAAAGPASGPPA